MTSRAGRHLVYLSLAGLIGPMVGMGVAAAPAMAQSYLADGSDSGSVTVDYSVLGQGGPGVVTRGNLPSGGLPGVGCSCANAPMGVIAAAPRPTFNNPFGSNLAMQAPAVPPGFITYAQATGAPVYASSGGGVVVLRAPSGSSEPQMAATPTEPANAEPLPATTETANAGSATPAPAPATTTEPAETQTATLPVTTPTQSASAASSTGTGTTDTGTGTTGTETAPAQPDQMPASVPSPVGPGDTVANAAQAPAPQPAGTDAQATTPPAAAQDTNAQATTPAPQPSTEQQAAVTPAAPAEGTTTPAPAPDGGNAAPSGGALPAGASRILYTSESDDVPATANADLDKVAAAMTADQNMRVQILAYAAGTEDTESKARRKSLARGLAIRSYLLKAGVPSTRIDVRALGSKADGGPADRVDVVPAT
jgi:outer membrane protein OmpA-like peptidoglycan-associated protein